jgi:hypothetical protein
MAACADIYACQQQQTVLLVIDDEACSDECWLGWNGMEWNYQALINALSERSSRLAWLLARVTMSPSPNTMYDSSDRTAVAGKKT